MKVLGLDGKLHNWNCKTKKRPKSSKLHLKARDILKTIFPFESIYEEVFLPGTVTLNHKGLRCDFYIPHQKLVVEVHGKQHFVFNSFHYANKLHFGKAQTRDRDKEIWCNINDIIYIGLPYNESEQQWVERIRTAHATDRTEMERT